MTNLGTVLDAAHDRRTLARLCPTWCNEPLKHSSDDGTRYHAGRETVVKLGKPDVTAAVSLSRDDHGHLDGAGEVYVYLSGDGPVGTGHDWAENLTPLAAIQLGQALIAAGLAHLQEPS